MLERWSKGRIIPPPTTVTFNPGDYTKTTYIYPLNNGQVPVHNPNLPYTGNKTVVLGIGAGTGYTPATNTANVNILDSAYPLAPVLFADALTNNADSTNWNITAANDDEGNESDDVDVEFGCNLYNTPLYPIPAPPNGGTNALKVTVNKSSGTGGNSAATAVNCYLTNNVFGGNFAVLLQHERD